MEEYKYVTVSVSLLENLVRLNREDQARCEEMGLDGMAEWHMGRAMAYEFILSEFNND
jgi:hypothetical protein